METRANLAVVGLFVLAVIVMGFGVVYVLLTGGRGGERAEVSVVFPGTVGGLVTGASASFNGIKVGEVTRLTFAPDDPNRVIAIVAVDPSTPLRDDTKASLGYQGLTGFATVQFRGGSVDAPLLFHKKDGQAVLYAESGGGGMATLVDGAQRLLVRADSAITTLDELVRDNRNSIQNTIRNVETFSDALAKNTGNVERFMSDVGRAADVLAKVSTKAEALIDNVDAIVTAVEPGQVRESLANIAKVTGDLAKSSGQINAIVVDAQSIVTEARKTIGAVDSARVNQFVSDAVKVASDLAKSSGQVEAVIRDAQATLSDARKVVGAVDPEKVAKAVDNASKVVEDLARSSGRVEGMVKQAEAALGDASKIVAAVDPEKIKSTVDSVAEFSKFLGSKQSDVTAVLDSSKRAAASIETFSADIARKSGDVTALVDSASRIIGNLEKASKRVDDILVKVDGLLGSDDGKGLLSQGRAFFAEAIEAARQFRETSATFQARANEVSAGITAFTGTGLREVREFVSDGRRTLGTIERAVNDFDRNPSRVLFGGSGSGGGKIPEFSGSRR